MTVKDLFEGLSKEIYFGQNFRLVLLTARKEELKALCGIVLRAEKARDVKRGFR